MLANETLRVTSLDVFINVGAFRILESMGVCKEKSFLIVSKLKGGGFLTIGGYLDFL